MDREKLVSLRTLLDTLLGENEPTCEELDFDKDAVELYTTLHHVSEALAKLGY